MGRVGDGGDEGGVLRRAEDEQAGVVAGEQGLLGGDVGGGEGAGEVLGQLVPDAGDLGELGCGGPADGGGRAEVGQQGGGAARPEAGRQVQGQQVADGVGQRAGHGGRSGDGRRRFASVVPAGRVVAKERIWWTDRMALVILHGRRGRAGR